MNVRKSGPWHYFGHRHFNAFPLYLNTGIRLHVDSGASRVPELPFSQFSFIQKQERLGGTQQARISRHILREPFPHIYFEESNSSSDKWRKQFLINRKVMNPLWTRHFAHVWQQYLQKPPGNLRLQKVGGRCKTRETCHLPAF